MPQYMMVYKGPAMDMSKITPERGKAMMDAWMKWMKKAGKAIVDPGNPFGQSISVVDNGAKKKPAKLTGYTIVQAKTMAGAKALTKGHPFLTEGKGRFSIDLFEVIPM